MVVRLGDDGLPSLTPATSKLHHLTRIVPTNTMVYDTRPHDRSYQGDATQKKPFILVKVDRHDGEVPFKL